MAIRAKGMARARKPSLIGHRRSSSFSRRRVSADIGRRGMFKKRRNLVTTVDLEMNRWQLRGGGFNLGEAQEVMMANVRPVNLLDA